MTDHIDRRDVSIRPAAIGAYRKAMQLPPLASQAEINRGRNARMHRFRINVIAYVFGAWLIIAGMIGFYLGGML